MARHGQGEHCLLARGARQPVRFRALELVPHALHLLVVRGDDNVGLDQLALVDPVGLRSEAGQARNGATTELVDPPRARTAEGRNIARLPVGAALEADAGEAGNTARATKRTRCSWTPSSASTV